MKGMKTCILLTILSVAGICAQSKDQMESMKEEQRVLDVEDAYVVAEVNRDESALRQILDDRFVYNKSDGSLVTKEEYIGMVLKLSMVDQIIRERTIHIERNFALVFGTAELHFSDPEGGENTISTIRYTATYAKRGEEWKMLAVQLQPHRGLRSGEEKNH